MTATIHVIGAGLSGLSAAVRLAQAGRRVVVHEAAPRPGGRCRSFTDAGLGRVIDNGSHLILSGNHALIDLARLTGGIGKLRIEAPAVFPFLELGRGARWQVAPGGLWLFDPARRVAGSRVLDYLPAVKLLFAGASRTAADLLPADTLLYRRLWRTLVVSVLNGPPERVSARLFAAVVRETLLKGEAACRPIFAPEGLAAALIDPAVAFVVGNGGEVRTGARVDRIDRSADRVSGLWVAGDRTALGADDAVVLALPPWRLGGLLPELPVPDAGQAIVNVHFRLPDGVRLADGPPFLGLIGGTAEWLFQRDDVVSATISAADHLAERDAGEVASLVWADVAQALGSADLKPLAYRVIKEKRATFDQTPANQRLRPGPATCLANLALAGDWTATGLPATLEGATRSGVAAARFLLRR